MIFLDVCNLYLKAAFSIYFLSQVQIKFLQKCVINLNFVAAFETRCMLCTSRHAEYPAIIIYTIHSELLCHFVCDDQSYPCLKSLYD